MLKNGLMKLFLIILISLFLNNCSYTNQSHTKVSPQYLEDCPIPARKGKRNRDLRQYTIDLYKSLLQCNIDKKAIREELK